VVSGFFECIVESAEHPQNLQTLRGQNSLKSACVATTNLPIWVNSFFVQRPNGANCKPTEYNTLMLHLRAAAGFNTPSMSSDSASKLQSPSFKTA
jgi:hypothetical protein